MLHAHKVACVHVFFFPPRVYGCMCLCEGACVFGSLDSWFWGRQGVGWMEGTLEIGGGNMGVVYMRWQERNGVHCGGWRGE